VESPPVFHAVHTDAHGVPYAVTDSTLRIRWRAIMSPTGAPVAEEGDLPMPLRWPGHVRDETSGWHDSGLRTYDPQAGHYLEPDPAGPTAGGSPYGYPGLPDKQMRTRAAAFGVKSQAVGTEPQAMDTEPPAARAVPCRVGNDVALPQAETMSADMRGYGKWLREALAPDPPAPHGGGPG
jgi:RHS repeat-associated protein